MNVHRITYNPRTKSCSLYFIGCNFRCTACYWKEIYPPRVNLDSLRLLKTSDILEILTAVNPEHVVLISGDPRLNNEFCSLPRILRESFRCQVRLMTNGYILPDLEGLGQVSLSIKALDDDLHRKYTGKSNRRSLGNFRVLYENNVNIAVSTVYIPGLIDAGEIASIARYVGSVDRDIPFRVIGYMPVNGLPYRKPSYEEVESVAAPLRQYLEKVEFSSPVSQDYSGIVDLFTNRLRKH